MRSVILSDTQLEVSVLSFGTSRLHHLRSRGSIQDLLSVAWAEGFTHFDTSPYYGYGLAEAELGRFDPVRCGAATVATKVGMYPPGERSVTRAGVLWKKVLSKLSGRKVEVDWAIGRARRSLETSLNALRRDYVDLLLLHEPSPGILNTDEFGGWLVEERQRGRVRAWGVAGDAGQFSTWLPGHELAAVQQVRDSIDEEPFWWKSSSRAPQLTFGYLSSRKKALSPDEVYSILRAARLRNPDGSILVSTRDRSRVPALVAAVEESPV